MKVWVIFALLLCLSACAGPPEPLAAPPQHSLLEPVRFDRIGYFAGMNQPNAPMYFVRDISPILKDSTWRWTGKEPTLRFRLPVTGDLSFLMDFALPEPAMRATGPVTITIHINGRVLASNRYDTPGQQHFLQPVPAALLNAAEETTVSAGIDKLWRTKMDGRPVDLGFILVRAGFVQ